jgi:lysosomal acid phosphatase
MSSNCIFVTPLWLQLRFAGPLVGEIAQNMEDKGSGSLKPDRKMVVYSAHDLTIVNVWRALGFTDLIKPDYGASLVFELHTARSGTSYEVKVRI